MSITYAREDELGLIAIDDGKVNAMGAQFFADLNAALDRAEADRPGAIVIAGRPGCLSAGLDLKLIPTLSVADRVATLITFGRTMLRVFAFPFPTVAAMTGHAIAGGAFLALGCDLRVWTDGPYRLHANEVAIGLALPTFARTIVESVVDVRWRNALLLHSRPVTPPEALARGFVDELVAADAVVTRARELAHPLTRLNQAAYAATKRRMRATALREAESRLEEEMTAAPDGSS